MIPSRNNLKTEIQTSVFLHSSFLPGSYQYAMQSDW